MKTLFKETTENTSKTPGQTAMKGLFAEEKESCVKTPNQVSSINSSYLFNILFRVQ